MGNIERLVANPNLTLSFDKNGREIWKKQKKQLTDRPITKEKRNRGKSKYGVDSDELLVWILRLNPGMELQLSDCHGQFPYVAMYAKGYEDIIVPQGLYLSNGKICCQGINHQQIKLAEIRL